MEVGFGLSPQPWKVGLHAVVALIVTVAVAAPAIAQNEDADALFAKGVEHYQAKEFAEAAVLFAKVFELKPSVDVHFAWAQAERFADNCPRALELLADLLATKLSKTNKRAVLEARKQCQARVAELEVEAATELAAAKAAEAEAEAAKAAEAASAAEAAAAAAAEAEADAANAETTSTDSETRAMANDSSEDGSVSVAGSSKSDRWRTNAIGGGLVGLGVVGVGAGVALVISGRTADRDAKKTESYAEFLELTDRAESRGRLGMIGLVAGGGLITAGLVWYALGRSGSEGSQTVAGWIEERGGGVTVNARF